MFSTNRRQLYQNFGIFKGQCSGKTYIISSLFKMVHFVPDHNTLSFVFFFTIVILQECCVENYLQTWQFFFSKKFGKFNNFTLFNFGIKGWWISLSRPSVVRLYWVSHNLIEVVPVVDKVDRNLQEDHLVLHYKAPQEHFVDH